MLCTYPCIAVHVHRLLALCNLMHAMRAAFSQLQSLYPYQPTGDAPCLQSVATFLTSALADSVPVVFLTCNNSQHNKRNKGLSE